MRCEDEFEHSQYFSLKLFFSASYYYILHQAIMPQQKKQEREEKRDYVDDDVDKVQEVEYKKNLKRNNNETYFLL